VSDISGIPIFNVNSSGLVTVDGPFTQTGGGATTLSGALNVDGVSTLANVGYLGDGLGSVQYTLQSANNGLATIDFGDAADSNIGRLSYSHVDDSFSIRTNNTTALTLDSSQNATFASGILLSQVTGRAIIVGGDATLDAADASIYLGNAPSSYGFDITYKGTGSGNTNSLDIVSTNAGSPVTALSILQDGNSTFATKAFSAATSSGDASSTLTTKGYVDGLITGATIYRGAWDPSNGGYGSPALNGVTQTSGYYYICSAAGAAEPNGTGTEPDTWAVGDWVIYNDVSGTGQWQKIDNSSVLSGVGTGQTVALWEGAGSVTDSDTLGNAPITVSGSNVGIGTTSPAKQLVVRGSAPWIRIEEDSVSNKRLDLWVDPTSAIGYIGANQSAQQLSFQTASSDRIRILNNGNVGIGTISPSEKLEVAGKVYIESQGVNWNQITPGLVRGALHLDPAGSAADNTGNAITFGASDRLGGTNAQAGIYTRSDGAYGTKMYFATTDDYSVGSKTGMMIDYNSNVGIGTTSPRGKLDIVGNTDDDTDFLTIQDNDTSAGSHRPSIRFRSNTAQIGQIVSLDNSMRFSVGTTEDSLLEITSSGNVGIGTATPLQPFQVDAGSNIASFRSVGTGQNNKELLIQTGGDRVVLDAKNADDGTAASLAFELGNSEKARLTTTGLGIGTTSPAAKLHVDGTAIFDTQTGAQPFYITRDGVTNQALKIHVDDAAAIFESIQDEAADNYGAFQFILDTGVTEPYFDVRKGASLANTLFRVDGNGNVGIGTTSPAYPLEVQSGGVGTVLRAGAAFVSIDSAGTALSPSLVFNGDTNTGIFRPSSDVLAFSTASTERMRIDPNGNVAIGATIPGAKLHVRDSSSPNVLALIRVQGGTTSGYAEFGSQSNYARILSNSNLTYAATYGVSYFYVNGSAAATINSTGMGIGTTSPGAKLDISGSTGESIRLSTSYPSDRSARGGIKWRDATNETAGIWTEYDGAAVSINFGNMYNSGYQTNTSMIIRGNGRVGIGTDQPEVSLDLNNTDAIKVPAGPTSLRPTGILPGMIRYNTTTSEFEGYSGVLNVSGSWGALGGGGGGGLPTKTVDAFTGSGQGSINLSVEASNKNYIDMYIDGVYQSKATYSIATVGVISVLTLNSGTFPTGVSIETVTTT